MRRKLGVQTLALVAAVLWLAAALIWLIRDAELPAVTAPRPTFPALVGTDEERSAPKDTQSTSHLRIGDITSQQKEHIEMRLSQAKSLLHQIELNLAKPAGVSEAGAIRSESIQVAGLRVEDLQPVYDALSRSVDEFEENSAAREAFRREADAFFAKIRSRPSKVVMRSIDSRTGDTTYKVATLSENAKLSVMETGGMRIDGWHTMKLVGPGEESEAAADFFDPPTTAETRGYGSGK